jgi:hypothetical protein
MLQRRQCVLCPISMGGLPFGIVTRCYGWLNEKNTQRRAIKHEFEPVGPTLLKDAPSARHGLLVSLQGGGFLVSYLLASLFHRVERRFRSGNRTANHFIRKQVPLHYHPVI